MGLILIKIIKLYQLFFSPDKRLFLKSKPTCVFYPTCSDYSIGAIKKYGSIVGVYKGFKRILRCHPWQEPKVDMP